MNTSVPWLPFGITTSARGPNEFKIPSNIKNMLIFLSSGIHSSNVSNGKSFALFVLEMKKNLNIAGTMENELLEGIGLFFDQNLRNQTFFFHRCLPCIASTALRMLELLEQCMKNMQRIKTSKDIKIPFFNSKLLCPLQVVPSQQPGMILMTQELARAFLTGSLFCSYFNSSRGHFDLSPVNFTELFYGVRCRVKPQIEKLKCLIHYFNATCNDMPTGTLSFERKVLNHNGRGEYSLSQKKVSSFSILSSENIWKNSTRSLCPFITSHSGTIEDDGSGSLEVNFANKYLGGGTLKLGCVQEEIKFVISPELIVGMIFFPSMQDNETIQIIGCQRFSKYAGYGQSFRFNGGYKDNTEKDSLNRRKTFVVAMDALYLARTMEQFQSMHILRELQKALCGFLQHGVEIQNKEEGKGRAEKNDKDNENHSNDENEYESGSNNAGSEASDLIDDPNQVKIESKPKDKSAISKFELKNGVKVYEGKTGFEPGLGVSTGNLGCGVFGGDLHLKSLIQWIAASQAQRTFISYFGDERSIHIEEIVSKISIKNWSVKDLYDIILKYAQHVESGHRPVPFFDFVSNFVN